MKCYCTGPIKKMYVKSIDIKDGLKEIVTENIVLKHDAPFYFNMVGRLISFEYATFLPTANEAIDFVEEFVEKYPDRVELATCLYADYEKMEVHEVSKDELKKIKKMYKQLRKQNKSS